MCFLCCFSPLNLRLHRNTPAGFLLGGDHSPQWKSIRVKDAIHLSGTAMGVSIYYHQNGSPVRFSLHCVSPVTLAWSNCRLGKVLGVLLRWQATKEKGEMSIFCNQLLFISRELPVQVRIIIKSHGQSQHVWSSHIWLTFCQPWSSVG